MKLYKITGIPSILIKRSSIIKIFNNKLLKSLKIIGKEEEGLSMLARVLLIHILKHNHLIKDPSIIELTILKLANLR
jgi:hypothetical protein